MINEYIRVTGQDGEIYEVSPTDALLSFLQRLAEEESEVLSPQECETTWHEMPCNQIY